MNEEKKEQYLRPRDIAATLGVSRQAIYKWIREGRLPSVRFGRAVRVPRTALAEFIQHVKGNEHVSGEDDTMEKENANLVTSV